jgi:GNAT superfamily N-acetyltransferase
MRDLSLGWATDLAVLEHTGSVIEDRGDHLLVRSPQNPDFHWGNCLVVTDTAALDDASTWVERFRAGFPEADWVAIGLPRMPDNATDWAAHGLELSLDDVLSTRQTPRSSALPDGYTVRELDGDDWEQSVALAVAENDRTAEYEPRSHERFLRARMRSQRSLSERGVAAFFGAFATSELATGELVAELGIVRCGSTARYQNVGTDERHRGRGLASHLLGVAAEWARTRGGDTWVIVTEAVNPAGRVYRRAGFELDAASVQAYCPPPK